jgi:hypothetical protein
MFSSSSFCVLLSWYSLNTLLDVGDKVTISENPDVDVTIRLSPNF